MKKTPKLLYIHVHQSRLLLRKVMVCDQSLAGSLVRDKSAASSLIGQFNSNLSVVCTVMSLVIRHLMIGTSNVRDALAS
jgi:hypothetical protein